MLDVHSHLGVLSPEPGEVFHDDYVDLVQLNIVDHSLEIRAVEVGTAPSVITVTVTNFNTVFLAVLGEQGFLRCNV